MGGASSSRRAQQWLLAMGMVLAALLLAACQGPQRDMFQEGLTAYQKGDYAVAIERWKPLAEAGDPRAQTNVGLMYSQGKGVPKDAAEAFSWYQKAAMQNYMDAEYNLALLYRDGKGVKTDFAEAIRWFQRAAERGHLEAQVRLGDIYFKGTGVQADSRMATKWYEAAANKGEPEAEVALGNIYAKGDGVPMDRVRAYFWYSTATYQDFDPLMRARALIGRMRLVGDMEDDEIAEGERQAEEWRDVQRTEANQ
jgi:uncharacterized protein